MPAKYARPYSKGQKNDFRDAETIAQPVQRPTMKFVATKTADQLDLQALHRIRERLVSQRTGIINQIRAFMLERGIAVRQGLRRFHDVSDVRNSLEELTSKRTFPTGSFVLGADSARWSAENSPRLFGALARCLDGEKQPDIADTDLTWPLGPPP
jgi:hypothetical protein